MKRKIRLVHMLIGAFMGVMLCGCPGFQNDQGPLIVAKMDRDYSEYAYYWNYPEDSIHLLKKVNDGAIEPLLDSFYLIGFGSAAFDKIVFTSRLGNEIVIGESVLLPTDSIIDDNPFKEIYEFYDDGEQDKKKLRNIIKNKEFDRLTRIK